MKGWLVNDCLTCIPGTKTFWHDLLESVPGLEDKTFGYTDFGALPRKIEKHAKKHGMPDYIIRNATYFDPINLNVKTFSLMQDVCDGDVRKLQIKVCNASCCTVFNTHYIADRYWNDITESKKVIIPLGVDFDLFKPLDNKESLQRKWKILPNSILYIGSSNVEIKGFDLLMEIVEKTNHNFCFVLKDDWTIQHPRIKVFNRVGHESLVEIMNACELLVCTSRVETQHLSGIETAGCNLPIVASPVGIYGTLGQGNWGELVNDNDFITKIDYVMNHKNQYSPRQSFIQNKLDKKSCMDQWKNILFV